jgi:two-component system response regulator AlgR
MKILIVDDEPLARSRLRDLLDDIGGHQVAGEAANGREAIELVQQLHPDVVLLDIHMPEMSGLEVAIHLNRMDKAPPVIFTTAYSEHALAAFDANAVDYLLKPIRAARLEQALAKAQPLQQQQLAALGRESGQARSHISANYRGGIKLIPVEEIIYFHSDSKYVAVHTADGEVLIDESLKNLEQEFTDRFTRIHRNSLVANASIEALEKIGENHFHLRLRGCDTPLEISRRQLPTVRKLISDLAE